MSPVVLPRREPAWKLRSRTWLVRMSLGKGWSSAYSVCGQNVDSMVGFCRKI